MKRRIFLQGGSAAAVMALTACGGGGGGTTAEATADAGAIESASRRPRTVAPTPTPTPAPAPAPAPVNGVAYPFGSRIDGRYPNGLMPTSASNATMDTQVKSAYDRWKATRLIKSPTFRANHGIFAGQDIADGYHVKFSNTYSTVSEGISYGMLITVLMAGHDPQARTYFDGLYRVARGRPAYGWMNAGRAEARFLLEWRLANNMDSAGEGWNATDGDLDIALALLMAHRQWGSGGAINYRQAALDTINAMKTVNFAPTGEPRGPQRTNTRTSDHMIGHFRSFKSVTGDGFWDTAIERCFALVSGITNNYSPSARLQPGFIVDCLTNPQPSPGNLIEGPYEGIYDGNAIRNPWRWGTDYLYSADERWRVLARDITTTLKNDCGGNPFNLGGLYNLNGTVNGGRYFAECTAGPLLVGAMTDPAHQAFLNTLWDANANNFSTEYYEAELQLLPMIVASGNWWRP